MLSEEPVSELTSGELSGLCLAFLDGILAGG